ncbi:TfuA-like protein [Pyxidicoccus trucidator]|uniref:TfuA-like protein n=1 Tax=Pyxidicoccus trucidator TaxID=2709662 RepID=UPI0013DBD3CE|nr:TfuA-like protein [Pyxidicoccus trucidator]
MASPPPIVFLGPSLSRGEAEALLPGADFRPPVRRGDLYRARASGGSVFLIVDGVFMQQHAISPREIVDVVRDGAWVVGASSMGALRAAECWPAGMQGVGSIYRLFRRGSLTSDDEVAVVFDPESERPGSIALVNVRHAVARAVRQGQLLRSEAERLVRVAEETFYAERTWRTLLARAGFKDGKQLERRLSGWDLKAEDARRGLRYVARRLSTPPGRARGARRKRAEPGLAPRTREQGPDALAGLNAVTLRRELARWHLVSGRYTRHALVISAASPEWGFSERLRMTGSAASVLAAPLLLSTMRGAPARFAATKKEQEGLGSLLALRLVLAELWRLFITHEALFAARLWQQLSLSHELDAEVFRWRAIHEAAARARAVKLEVRPRDRHLARQEVAHAHGFDTWEELEHTAREREWWSSFLDYVETRALSMRMRGAP